MTWNRRLLAVATVALVTAVVVIAISPWEGDSGSSPPTSTTAATPKTIPQPRLDKLIKLTRSRLAPESARVDLAVPSFSNSTRITNPLFPIGTLRSALLVGRFHAKPWRAETTLLPGIKTVDWAGRHIRTLRSQFVAYLGGRIYETAVDLYAQSDDGAVWYLGEDARGYRHGALTNTAGTWIAGVDGPAAMIMPGHPKVGDVYRTENVPGRVFEEVTVKKLGATVNGPLGPVHGAMVGHELHMEGDVEDKTFAPGYGEFFSGLGADYEANALAIPVDSAHGPVPPELTALRRAARAGRSTTAAWNALRRRGVPKRLGMQLGTAIRALRRARDRRTAVDAGLEVELAALDLELRYRPVPAIDRARIEVWKRRLRNDRAAGDAAGVRGDVLILKYIRDRLSA